MKMKLLVLSISTALFFSGMAALTLSARGIREARLPHVTVGSPTRESFSVADDNGDVMQHRRNAIPKEFVEMDGKMRGIYTITLRIVNGEERNYAQRVHLETGLENDGYVEVTGGLMGYELIIFSSDRPFGDGDEVIVVE